MFSGKHFRLRQEILAISSRDGERVAITVPPGEIIEVLSGPRQDDQRMVDVLWIDRSLAMFTDDILRRGDEVRTATHRERRTYPSRIESVHTSLTPIPQVKASALFNSLVGGDISIFEFLDLAKRMTETEVLLLGDLLKNHAASSRGASGT